MPAKRRKSSGRWSPMTAEQQPAQPSLINRQTILNHCLVFLLGGVMVAAVVMASPELITGKTARVENAVERISNDSPAVPSSLSALLALTPEQLEDVDLARMNLLCAEGLPGSQTLDMDKCLATIDRWAERVRFETERHLYRLTDPRFKDHAEHYQHSEARFRAEWLVNVLQQDIGVHYHAGFVSADQDVPPFKTSKETFLHGLLDHDDARQAFGGNCVSLPVLYSAVGRRLGYPIKLVNSKEHVFCRWMGDDHPNADWRDQFNFDGAGEGFSIDPDSFYRSWPRESSPQAVEVYDWLKPLTPPQELAIFLLSRGHVFRHVNNDQANAQVAYAHALRLWPGNRRPLVFLTETVESHWKQEFASHPNVYRQPQAFHANTQEDALLPWWKTPRGQAANAAMLRRLNDYYNRRWREQQRRATYRPPSYNRYGQSLAGSHAEHAHHDQLNYTLIQEPQAYAYPFSPQP